MQFLITLPVIGRNDFGYIGKSTKESERRIYSFFFLTIQILKKNLNGKIRALDFIRGLQKTYRESNPDNLIKF